VEEVLNNNLVVIKNKVNKIKINVFNFYYEKAFNKDQDKHLNNKVLDRSHNNQNKILNLNKSNNNSSNNQRLIPKKVLRKLKMLKLNRIKKC
jgi:hypothetical protein